MRRREFLCSLAAGTTGITSFGPTCGAATDASAKKPNILIIMGDQMTAALTGAYAHPVVKTPALNRLCAEGVRFDAAYTNCPLCTPARAAMLSGCYVSRTRTYDNGAILPCDVPTYAHHLRLAGYETVAAGKLHLVGADQLHGFERRLTRDIYPSTFKWTPDWRDYKQNGIKNQKASELEENKIGVRNRTKQLDYDNETRSRAIDFLRSRHVGAKPPDSRPFCLLVSFTHPHPPYLITPEYWNLYEGAEIEIPKLSKEVQACRSQMDRWMLQYEGVADGVVKDIERMRTLRRTYYGMVSYVDGLVGELLKTLEECGLREDTAVLFTADHGDMLCERQLIEKRSFYEWSARVPLIASYPKRWAKGRTRSEPVSLIDVFPTLVEFTKAPAPNNIDGRSFLNLLEGKKDEGPERVVLSEYHSEGVAAPCFMVRRGKFKYVYIHGHDTQLFDLERDPNEVQNLVGWPEFGGLETSLRAEIRKHFAPEKIEKDVYESQAERILMQKAMDEGQPTVWDYQPLTDASKR